MDLNSDFLDRKKQLYGTQLGPAKAPVWKEMTDSLWSVSVCAIGHNKLQSSTLQRFPDFYHFSYVLGSSVNLMLKANKSRQVKAKMDHLETSANPDHLVSPSATGAHFYFQSHWQLWNDSLSLTTAFGCDNKAWRRAETCTYTYTLIGT